MTAITLILTDAGLAALTNPAHTGTAALTISHIGLSQQHAGDAAVQQALTALPGEFKRLATFGGEVLAPRTIHVFLRDETADAYSLRAFGLYASTGVLLAVVSSETPIMEKVPATTLLQAVDLTFARDIDAELVFGDTNFVNPPATTTRLGVVELATGAETVAGERQDLAVTPWGLAQALLSWAQNFAAKAHRHLIIEIDGLSDALAAKANRNHNHGADDVNSGVFHIDRIPKLAIGWITGLTDQLAGLAAKDHKHPASDITSGQLHLDRLPAIPQSKVTGLVDALMTFALQGHKHDAADTTSGVFNVARIPALAMEKITGLVAALGGKADASSAIVMRGSLGGADLDTILGPGGYRQATAANAQLALNYPINNDGGSLLVVNPSSDTGFQTYHSRVTNRMWTRPFLAGGFYPWAEHWTSANFDPSTKADLLGAYFTGNSGVRHTGFAHFSIDSAAGQNRDLRFNTDGVTRWSVRATSAAETGANAGSNFEILRYADNGSVIAAALSIDRQTGAADFRAPLRLINTDGGSGNFVGGALLRLSNFAPGVIFEDRSTGTTNALITVDSHVLSVRSDPKGDESFDTIVAQLQLNQPTAPPGHNTLRLATCAFVQQEIAAIPAPGNSTYTARGLIEMATDAEALAGTDQERAINPYVLKRRIDARAASNAETIAGSVTDKFITPSSLWSFAKSIGLNGYAQVPGTPLVIQWGRQAGSMTEGQRTVMLPIAFGGGCVAMLANPWNSSPTADYYMQIVGRYLDRLVFMLNSASGSSGSAQGFDWLAVGFATGTADPSYSTGGGGGGGGGGLPPGGGGGGEEPIIRPEV